MSKDYSKKLLPIYSGILSQPGYPTPIKARCEHPDITLKNILKLIFIEAIDNSDGITTPITILFGWHQDNSLPTQLTGIVKNYVGNDYIFDLAPYID